MRKSGRRRRYVLSVNVNVSAVRQQLWLWTRRNKEIQRTSPTTHSDCVDPHALGLYILFHNFGTPVLFVLTPVVSCSLLFLVSGL